MHEIDEMEKVNISLCDDVEVYDVVINPTNL